MRSANKAFTPQSSRQEKIFLEGPNSRWSELVFLFDVLREFVSGFRKLHFVGPCITVFGSARFGEHHKYYEMTRLLAGRLAKAGFTILTGGGPGVMEAANKGAQEAGGRSVGCNIKLPVEQDHNKYLDRWVTVNYFFVRKVLLTKYSCAFVVMPGGYGTLDEFFEAITLIQTGKVKRFPVVLMGKEYHRELYDHLLHMAEEKTIAPEDLELFLFTNSIDEAVAHIRNIIHGDLKDNRKMHAYRPWGILGERTFRHKKAGVDKAHIAG